MNTISMSSDTLQQAAYHFSTHDVMMAQLLAKARAHSNPLTVPTPRPESEYFASLARIIIGQQISTAAARTINERLTLALGTVTPDTITAQAADLPTLGLSTAKMRYLLTMAKRWPDVPTTQFVTMSDTEIISTLTTLPGIGTWSAEMFSLFTLARSNIFSYHDLGLMQSLYYVYELYPHYTRTIRSTVERWSPYRSVASLTLWYARDHKLSLPTNASRAQ